VLARESEQNVKNAQKYGQLTLPDDQLNRPSRFEDPERIGE